MPLSIVEEDGRIAVTSPYHPNFPARARVLGGTWDAARRVWLFDLGDRERVRTLCSEIYGHGRDRLWHLAARHRRRARTEINSPRARRCRTIMATAIGCASGWSTAGAEALPDYELLEMLLFAANPRGDVKPVAKALLARFGGFAATISADPEALAAAGLSLAGIAALKSVREAALRLMRAELQQQPVVNSWDKLIDYCTAQIAHGQIEEFHILFLDRKNVLIKHERQQKGTIDHTPVYPREVVKRALELGASALILVHNHPSGDPTPSKADIAVTQDIKKAAAPLGVVLHDHVIIGRNRHTSLRDLGLI